MNLIQRMLEISGIEYLVTISGRYNHEAHLSVKTDELKVKKIQEFCDHAVMAPFVVYVEKMK